MIASMLIEGGITPDFTAGHSLGEYTALVASGVMSFEDGVSVVHKRGLYMNDAVPAGEGAMAAILGLDAEQVKDVTDAITADGHCSTTREFKLSRSNRYFRYKIRRRKGLRSVERSRCATRNPLDVSGPFHSSLMKPAAEQLRATLDEHSNGRRHNSDRGKRQCFRCEK